MMLFDDFMLYLYMVFIVECMFGNVELMLVEVYFWKDYVGFEWLFFMLIFYSDLMIVLMEGLYVVGFEVFGFVMIGLLLIGVVLGFLFGYYY